MYSEVGMPKLQASRRRSVFETVTVKSVGRVRVVVISEGGDLNGKI